MKRRGQGEGSIYRRAQDGRWVGTVNLGWQAGKRVRKSFYGLTRREVQEKLSKALKASGDGLRLDQDRLTLAAFLGAWLSAIQPPAVRPSTWQRYDQIVRLHLIPLLGREKVAQLTPQAVERALGTIVVSLSARSALHVRAVLRTALNRAVRDGLATRNAASLATPPRVEYRQVESLAPADVSVFLKAIAGDRLEALYVLALATGMRQGELLGLRWSDVDLTNGTVRFSHALQRIGGQYRLVETKTSQSRRTVNLPAVAVEALARHREVSRRRDVVPLQDYVFTTRSGAPLDGTNVTRWFQAHLAAAGLQRIPFHSLRHTTASLLLAQGVHPRIVMEILGHSQISLTMNTYSHVIPALQQETAERMNALLTAT